MTLSLRMLAWPVATGLGFAFVVWFYELTDSTATWREVDEATSLSLLAWFVGPVLSWALIPAEWGRPSWAIWSLAAGGVAIFASLAVLVGLFIHQSGLQRFQDLSVEDLLYTLVRIGDHSVEKWVWVPGPLALYLMAPAVGYGLVLGMMSRVLAAIFFVLSALGSLFVYLFYAEIGPALGDLVPAMGREAGLSASWPLALSLSAVSGVFGATGILIWALAIGPAQDGMGTEAGERW